MIAAPLHGNKSCNASEKLDVRPGTYCSFYCDPGYFLFGKNESTCTEARNPADSAFNNPTPKCNQIDIPLTTTPVPVSTTPEVSSAEGKFPWKHIPRIILEQNISPIQRYNQRHLKVRSNTGADGGGSIAIYNGNLTEGSATLEYHSFQIHGASDPSICEVYFTMYSQVVRQRLNDN
ncbi:unnamed protein product [Clavelina lepadiformis]|uniref:Sushi domain-containing protein n=1 Tax=Clavelina lepadiformis TaxID=159417 RepID=A0ABP0F712_CLALP